MKKHLFFIITLAIFSTFITNGFASNLSLEEPEQDLFFSGAENSGSDTLASLYNNGLIENRFSYNVLRVLNAFKPIEKGGYIVEENMGALALYSRLIEPDYRYVTIDGRLEDEEIAERFANALGWNESQKKEFLTLDEHSDYFEGKIYLVPGDYVFSAHASPRAVRIEINKRLEESFGDSNCTFYVRDKEGNIHCSESYDTHKQNMYLYLQ